MIAVLYYTLHNNNINDKCAISQKWRMNDVSEDVGWWCMATFYLLFPLWHLFTCYSHAMATFTCYSHAMATFTCYSHAMATFTCYYGLFRAHKMSCTQCIVRKVVYLWKKWINLSQTLVSETLSSREYIAIF